MTRAILILQRRIDERLKLQASLKNNDDLWANSKALLVLNESLREIDPESSYELEYHGYTVTRC